MLVLLQDLRGTYWSGSCALKTMPVMLSFLQHDLPTYRAQNYAYIYKEIVGMLTIEFMTIMNTHSQVRCIFCAS